MTDRDLTDRGTTDRDVVIVSAARTPIGKAGRNGALKDVRADELGEIAVTEAVRRAGGGLTLAEVDELVMGCGQPAGEQAYGIGRAVAVLAGATALPAVTLQRYCASSLSAVRSGFHAIASGEADVVLAAGTESISRYDRGKSDGGEGTKNPRMAEGNPDGLPDLYVPMGLTAERVAREFGVSRQAQDEYALFSQERAAAARAEDHHAAEIVPVVLADGTVVDVDQSPRPGTTLEALSALQPVFDADGTVTAGNSCPLNDGAAALVMMSAAEARRRGSTPLARVRSTAVSALEPERMGVSPVEASTRALRAAGLSVADLDHVEINEAFAAQVLPCIDSLGLDVHRVNPYGGAIALGHPFGMTGARLIGAALNGLRRSDGSLALVTLCAAGGQGVAVTLERMS